MPDIDDIEIRSEEIQELMERAPAWMTRWGITLIVGIVIMFIVISWHIKYPEIIRGEVILTTIKPPIRIFSRANGQLIALEKFDGEMVTVGEPIAEIENPITKSGIDYLKGTIKRIKVFIEVPQKTGLVFDERDFVFGHIQTVYNELKILCIDYIEWNNDEYRVASIRNIRSKIIQHEKIERYTNNLISIADSELKNAEEKYSSDQHLYKEGILAKMEFFKEESSFRQKQQITENLRSSLAQNKIIHIDLLNQLANLEFTQKERGRKFKEEISIKIHELENQINQWQATYQIISPINGRLTYLKPITLNQNFYSGEPYFAVVPEHLNYIGLMNIPAYRVGKVKIGQSVKLKVDAYPDLEYGQLSGVVSKISELSNEKMYSVEISLSNGLISSYGYTLEFKPEMSGISEIITEDIRLIERMLHNFRQLLN